MAFPLSIARPGTFYAARILQIMGRMTLYDCIPFLYGFASNEKIVTKYIIVLSCIHQTSIKSNGKYLVVEAQILLMPGRFLAKPSGFCLVESYSVGSDMATVNQNALVSAWLINQ